MKKIAIITGASSGIGKQISLDLSKIDYECILLGRDLNKLKLVQSECLNSKIYQIDLTETNSIKKFTDTFLNEYHDFKNSSAILINNAGIVERENFEKSNIESWNRQFQTNLFGPVMLTMELLNFLKKQSTAKIINISSTLGIKPIKDTSAYSASKAAMNNWSMSLALELAQDKISVNTICPGIIETPLQAFYKTEDLELRNNLNQMQPLGRVGTPKDISNLVLYLVSDSCSWMTGSIIPLDGGILLG